MIRSLVRCVSSGPARWQLVPCGLFLVAACVLGPVLHTATEDEPAQPASAEKSTLDDWRLVNKLCEEATKGATAADRVRDCEKFLEQYPDHRGQKQLLKTLVDSYLQTGDYDPQRVAGLLESLAELDPNSYRTPMELVDDYYVKHALPVESGRRLLRVAAERRAEERAKIEREKDPRAKKRRDQQMSYQDSWAAQLEGLLLLVHDRNEEAVQALLAAKEKAGVLPRDIVIYEGDELVRRHSTGLFDSVDLGLSVAYGRIGGRQKAMDHLEATLGFFQEKPLKELHEEAYRNLDLKPQSRFEITSAPLRASAFTLKDLDGNEVSLADHEGEVVLLSFWATWCYWCTKEIPVLRQFEEKHRDKGVVVWAINTDRVTERAQIRPFIEDHNMPFTVLLGDAEKLTGYDYSALPTLYVIDRQGRVALASVGYDADLEEKLETKIASIIEGGPTPDRPLLRVEVAPDGFGVLWQTDVEGDADAAAVAPVIGDSPAEVGIIGRKGLMRWSAGGEYLGDSAVVSSWVQDLQVHDLDRDGKREWILVDYDNIKVLDAEGGQYWTDKPGLSRFELELADDIDHERAGGKEMVLSAHGAVVAVKNLPEWQLWRNDDFQEIESVVRDPHGFLLVQEDDRIKSLDAAGRVGAEAVPSPEGFTLEGRIAVDADRTWDFYSGLYDRSPELRHDIDGDGQAELLIVTWDGLVAYDVRDGELVLKIAGDDTSFRAAFGDIDGRPGDEIVLFVRQYGLVTLGRTPSAPTSPGG
jgi:peroxiredoxin